MAKKKRVSKNGARKGFRLSPPLSANAPVSREGARELLDFTKAFFDKQLQDELAVYLKTGDVKVKGGRKKITEKPTKIDLLEVSRYANPAIANVEASFGVYNPETITVETFDLMKKDPTISAGLAFIKLPIIALPWRIECDDEKIKRFLEQVLRRVWRRLIKSTLTAVDYGFASHEKVFAVVQTKVEQKSKVGKKKIHFDGKALVYKKFKAHHPSSIEVKLDTKENFDGIVQTTMAKEVTLKKDKCFFFTHDEEFGNPFGKSRLVAAYKFWYWKEVLYQFMLMYFERRGSPPILATAPPGDSQTDDGRRVNNMQLALDLGSSLLSNTIGVIPYEESKSGRENMWNVDYLSDDKRGEMFIGAINHLDIGILKALWIPEKAVTSEGSSGGYSLGSLHADLFLQSELGLINDIEAAMDEQVLPILVQANFMPDERAPARLMLDSLDWNRKIALKEIFLAMIDNIDGMVQSGLRPTVIPSLEELAGVLNVPVGRFDDIMEEVVVPGVENGSGTTPSDAQKPGSNVIPIKKHTPVHANRKSFPGSREADRKIIRPGGARAENMRAKLAEIDIGAFDGNNDGMSYLDVYEPIPDDNGEIRHIDQVRIWLMRRVSSSPNGLMEVKAGLMRLKIWSGMDYIPNFDLMGPEDIVRALRYMMDFHVEILYEAINRKLSDGDASDMKDMLDVATASRGRGKKRIPMKR